MLFLAPWMLAGLAAIGIPIAVHMLDRSRSEPVDWPSLRFLRIARQQSARRSRLKNLLVLLARCLLILLLILAMAMPYVENSTWGKPANLPTTLVILLDNSYSMGYRTGGGPVTRFERAKQLAMEQLTRLGADDEAALVLVNDNAQVMTEHPTRDHDAVRRLIQQARLSVRGTNLAAGLGAAFTVGNLDAAPGSSLTPPEGAADAKPVKVVRHRRKAWREVMLLTDMQQTAWAQVVDSKIMEAAANTLPVTVVDVSGGETANRFVRQIKLRDGIGGGKLSVQAELGIAGPSAGGQAALWIDGKKAGSPELIPADGGTVNLTAEMPLPGVHKCMVELDGDRLPIDDRWQFSLNVGGGGEVVLVDGAPSATPGLGETYFLDTALSLGAVKSGSVRLTRLTPEELSTAPLPPGGGVVLADVGHLDGSALTKIENFLRSGGNVLVTLGNRTDVDHVNRDWRFMPIHLDRRLGDPARSRAYAIQVDAAGDPLFAGPLDFAAVRYFAFIGSDPTALKNDGRVLARFVNGSPMLVEGRFGGAGKGAGGGSRVLVMTGPIGASWSNFPYRRVFLPFVDHLAAFLAKQQLHWTTVALGQPIRFTGPAMLGGQSVIITSPDGQLHTLTAQADEKAGTATATFGDTDQVGVYRVQADPGFGADGGFAVNLDTRESVLLTTDAELVKKIFAGKPVRVVVDRPQTLAGWAKQDEGKDHLRAEYWGDLLLAAFGMMVLETLLANRFTRRKAAAATPTTEYLGRRRTEAQLTGTGAK